MTRNITFTQEELALLSQWATRAREEAKAAEILLRPDSPQQRAALADIDRITIIKDKLRG